MREFRIGKRTITDDSPPYICAEISHNHLGSLELAREMIRLAAEAGASAIKFQKRGSTTYEGLRSGGQVEYADLREIREFPGWDYALLMREAHNRGLDFIATAFDQESADFLVANRADNIDAIKIASGDITNTPLLEYVAKLGKPMIVSTGGCDLADVLAAHRTLTNVGAKFCLLHCTSEYPVHSENVNLRVIETFRKAFPNTVIGFSNHIWRTFGRPADCVAFAIGARVFERHFTITPDIGTGEHAFAMTLKELKNLVGGLLDIREMLGDGVKRKLDAEATGILRLGKHLVYARDLPAGHVLTAEDFEVAAPGNGIPPNRMGQLVGRTLHDPVAAGEAADWPDFTDFMRWTDGTLKAGDTVTNKAIVDNWGMELRLRPGEWEPGVELAV